MDPVRAATRAAVTLDALMSGRTRLHTVLADKIMAFVAAMLAGGITPDDCDRLIREQMQAGYRAHIRLSQAAYRRILLDSGATAPAAAVPSRMEAPDVTKLVADLADLIDEADGSVTDPDVVLQKVTDAFDPVLETAQSSIRDAVYEASPQATRYRRVVHPELSKGGACGLCIVASTQIYTRPDLKPIHDRCHCDVLPIVGEVDPGHALNGLDLGSLYEAAGDSTHGWNLKKVRVKAGEIVKTAPSPASEDGPASGGKRAGDRRKASSLKSSRDVWSDPVWLETQIALTKQLPASGWKTQQMRRLQTAYKTVKAA